MPWFPVDDGFAFHHKAVQAGNAAVGLWVRAGAWCAQQLTDGHVPANMVPVLGTAAQARRLVRVGLWHEVEGGYQFHGWTENSRNPTRSKVEEQRTKAAKRKAHSRENNQLINDMDASSFDRGSDEDRSTIEQRSTDNTSNSEEPQDNGGSHTVLAGAGARARSSPLLSSPRELSNESSPPCSPPEGDERGSERAPAKSYPDGFEEFWSIYPKRVGKQAAVKAWRKAIKLADTETILDGARRYAASRQGEDPKYTAHPSTWLNAGRWDDEPQPKYVPPPAMSTRDQRVADVQALKARMLGGEPAEGEDRQLRAITGGRGA